MFFKVIVLNRSLGKTQCYAIHVEFQVRVSPHIHSFIRILNAPKLSKSTKEEYATWMDVIRTDLSDPNEEPELCNFVCTYQIHRHSKKYGKYRNDKSYMPTFRTQM